MNMMMYTQMMAFKFHAVEIDGDDIAQYDAPIPDMMVVTYVEHHWPTMCL